MIIIGVSSGFRYLAIASIGLNKVNKCTNLCNIIGRITMAVDVLHCSSELRDIII